MNIPPCPVCGTPLRWFPDQQAWGCDRCRQMIAPAPHGMPRRRGKLPWILVGGGVVAIGTILLVVGLRGGDKVDCEKYVDRRVALATAGLSGADVELVGQRSRAVHSDACHGGNVSADQAACVDTAASQEEALRCFIPERAGSAAAGSAGAAAGSAGSAATAPPQSTTPQSATAGTTRERAEQAAAAATEVIDAFADAIGDDRCGKEAAVHAVALATAEKVALVRAALSDPAVAAEAGKLSGDAFSTAFERWSRTRIEGTCRVEEDIEIIQGMLSPRGAP